MKRRYFFVIGLLGSGKASVAKILKKELGSTAIFEFGDIIREEIRKRKQKYTFSSDEAVVKWFHTNGRQRLLASRMWKKVKNRKEKIIIIDGCRNVLQYRTFCKLAKEKIPLIYVYASSSVRERRMLKRKRFDKEHDKQFHHREKRELRQGLRTLIKWKKYLINNSSTRATTKKQVRKLSKKLF